MDYFGTKPKENLLNKQLIITSTTTWEKSKNAGWVDVLCVGGGGGGGGIYYTGTAGPIVRGGGGGAGEIVSGRVYLDPNIKNYTITIGSGGLGGSTSNNTHAGESTWFGYINGNNTIYLLYAKGGMIGSPGIPVSPDPCRGQSGPGGGMYSIIRQSVLLYIDYFELPYQPGHISMPHTSSFVNILYSPGYESYPQIAIANKLGILGSEIHLTGAGGIDDFMTELDIKEGVTCDSTITENGPGYGGAGYKGKGGTSSSESGVKGGNASNNTGGGGGAAYGNTDLNGGNGGSGLCILNWLEER